MKLTSRYFLTAASVVVLFIGADRWIFHQRLTSGAASLLRRPASFAFQRLGFFRSSVIELKHLKTLSVENANLRNENMALVARIAREEALVQENDFLRKALKVQQRIAQPQLIAGIFQVSLSAPGYRALLNKGADDGVNTGDIIVSGQGVFIGRVFDVGAHTATIRLANDPAIEVSAQVLGKGTTGIIKGNLSRGLLMNLVVQEDQINEGDTVISSGRDPYPAGLVLGTVRQIEINESEVFKKVMVDPAFNARSMGEVLVLKPQ